MSWCCSRCWLVSSQSLLFFCLKTSRRFTRCWLVSSQSFFFLFQHLETLYTLLTCLLSIFVVFFISTPRDALLVVDLSLLAVSHKLLSEKKTKFPTNLFHSRSSFCFVNLFVSVDVDLFLVAFDSELKLL